MARAGFVLMGLVMTLVPARIREAFEELALKTSGEVIPVPPLRQPLERKA